MLTWIIDTSLRNRWLVIGASGALVVAGLLSFRALPVDAFPDTTPIQVQINATATALTPVEVERQITIPIEQALAGLPGWRSCARFRNLAFLRSRFVSATAPTCGSPGRWSPNDWALWFSQRRLTDRRWARWRRGLARFFTTW